MDLFSLHREWISWGKRAMTFVVPYSLLHWPSLAICASRKYLTFRKPSEGQKEPSDRRSFAPCDAIPCCNVPRARFLDGTIWFSKTKTYKNNETNAYYFPAGKEQLPRLLPSHAYRNEYGGPQ
jgi:hypothetical protein